MTARLMILNGPNLNLLGVREPHIYGSTTLAAIKASCEEFAKSAGAQLSFHQSNHEGALVDLIQAAREEADAIIINPAGYSFTSIAIFDALKIFEGPIIEVHISNIHARDELHRQCANERTPSASEMHHPLVVVGANENSAKSTAFALLAESLQFELVSGKSDEGDPWCSGVGNVCLCS